MSRKDINFNMAPHPLTKDLTLVKGVNAVMQSIKNIVLTSFAERSFEPDFGSGVRHLLFENNTPTTQTALQDSIKTAITNYEPDCEVVSVNAIWDDSDQSYSIDISFTYLNSSDVITTSISLISLIR